MTLQEYRAKATVKTCLWCGATLPKEVDCWGPHDAGWIVDGFEDKQWLYVTCIKCGYDWALSKLGVPRQAKVT